MSAASLALAGAFIAAPAAAQAAFTASTAGELPVSTGSLSIPASAMTTSCVLRNGKNLITIAVDLTATSPRSTSHPLNVYSPDGKLRYSGDAAALPQGTFRVPGNESAMTGTWVFNIHDEYASGTGVLLWTGQTLSGTIVC
ncbi:MAG TPA: hypothetical protein VF867_15520 [Arthrobacter sp.]